ncbi:RNA polymerase sigma factor [Ruminococcus sp. 5_1_39BFAA]|uniref:RNA polymerase sigma factor n=1 Tax=Ruminococcus sp. 5_1_39BFAA TaxID=457412 RepID=UPI003564C660
MNLLIRKARKHDKAAFQELMEQQGKAMYKVAKAILKNDEDVADAMQETALTCWEKIDTLKKDKYFQTWLTRILINNCNAIYRQRMKMVSEETVSEAWAQEDGYANAEWENFLNCLDEKYRTVVMLYYVQGFKTREIAEILQINESTVRGRLATARKKLEVQYRGDEKSIRTAGFDDNRTFCMAKRGF